MTNLSSLTRREQVLEALRAAKEHGNGWVSTVDISNAQTGGSAGTSRIRELRGLGYVIETRAHPDPDISQYQYRLVDEPDPEERVDPLKPGHGEEVIGYVIESEESPGGLEMVVTRTAVLTPDLPFVHWEADPPNSATGRLRDFTLRISQAWVGWAWSASRRERGAKAVAHIAHGMAATREEAKRAAVEAVMGAS